METLGQLVEELEKDELLDFLVHYNKYIVNYYESHDYPCQPVCMLEYFNNDYMTMIDELYS
jgi:excinuclease UvrABC helicase subunit UvrB